MVTKQKVKIFSLVICVCLILLCLMPSFVQAAPKTDSQKIDDITKKISSVDVKVDFFGTEYHAGDNGTAWLQLLRDYLPINDATCYLTVYYPDKTKFLDSILMFYLSGSDGIYYYDTVIPDTTGVYMASASCYIPARAFTDDFLDYSNILSYANITVSGGKVFLGSTSIPFVPYAWYHLNEISGINVNDSSGNSRNGTTVNNPAWVAGKLNNALNLSSASNQYANFGSTSFSFERTQPVSYELWFRTSTSGIMMLFDKIVLTPQVRGLNIYLTSGSVVFASYTTGTNYIYVSTTNTFNNGYWNHLVITYDGSSLASGVKIYVNNILQVVAVTSNNLNGTIINAANFLIGARLDGYQFNGSIDEAVIYNRVLDAAEVSFRYNDSAGTENMFMTTGANATDGFIMSKPVILNGIRWFNFSSDYALNGGSVNFSIINTANGTICSGLGNVSLCANTTTPIKLYARLTRPTQSTVSPEINDWWISWIASSIEELRGAGELHISSAAVSCNVTCPSYNFTYIYHYNNTYNYSTTYNYTLNLSNITTAKEVWQYFNSMDLAEASPATTNLITGGVVHALDSMCINDTHIRKYGDTNVCYGGDCFGVGVNRTELCQYGCDTFRNECKGSPTNMWLIALAIFIIIVGFYLFARKYL